VAYQSVSSVQKLVGQLLETSEIDQGTVAVKKAATSAIDLIHEVVESVQIATKARISVDMPVVQQFSTDPHLFKRMLFEIVDNAVEYSQRENQSTKTTKTAPLVSVRGTFEKDANRLLIEITDTGIGIPDDQQTLVFTKFFRGNNVDTTTIAGAGLGLYIAREYAKLLGGKIWFKSVAGEGTTFSVAIEV
jgi:signal transduction histidine kinase